MAPAEDASERAPELLSGRWGKILAVAVVVGALGVRLPRIADPAIGGFHPVRQLHGALVAQSLHWSEAQDVPGWQRAMAAVHLEDEPILEPPLLERMAIAAAGASNGDYLLSGRLLSVLFWMLGAAPLHALARRHHGRVAAMAALAFYLLSPFAVLASRSFQPDPLMVATMVAALWAIDRHDEAPGRRRLAEAALLSALAVFIKPGAGFFIAPAFAALAVTRRGARRGLLGADSLVFAAVTVLPALAWSLHGILVSRSLKGSLSLALRFDLLSDEMFWNGWLTMIDKVLGLPLLAASLFGVALATARLRALLLGLWGGYLAFVFVFKYHVATHDYYHLPLIPIAALSLLPLVERLTAAIPARAYAVAAACAFLPLWAAHRAIDVVPDPAPSLKRIEAVAAAIGHTPRLISVSDDYGLALAYYGGVSSVSWPSMADLRLERIRGLPEVEASERLEKMLRERDAEYLVVLASGELAAQPDLQTEIARRAVLAEGDGYKVIDLRAGAR